jgi:hypothetical protein
MTTPIIKPRVPLYLRQNGPRKPIPFPQDWKDNFIAADKAYTKYIFDFHKGWKQGSFCRCKNPQCLNLTREVNLGKEFRDGELRATVYCKVCSCSDIEYFDNLTPAQEALLEP